MELLVETLRLQKPLQKYDRKLAVIEMSFV